MDIKDKNFYFTLSRYFIYPSLFILIGIGIIYLFQPQKTKVTQNNTKHTPSLYLNINNSVQVTKQKAQEIRSQEKIINIYIGKNVLSTNLATTTLEQEVGLMKDTNLEEKQSMLFTFNHNSIHTFWMAYTYIPLDMLFISSNYKIVEIIKAIPCTSNKCLLYKPKYNSKYVIEVNPSFVEKNNIRVGNSIKI